MKTYASIGSPLPKDCVSELSICWINWLGSVRGALLRFKLGLKRLVILKNCGNPFTGLKGSGFGGGGGFCTGGVSNSSTKVSLHWTQTLSSFSTYVSTSELHWWQ